AENGIPCMANDGGAKAYVHSLGEALHYELKPLGVHVTVLAAGITNTAVLEKFALDPKTMPMKPMSVEQCVSEGISGLLKNRSRIVPGRLNRILNALVPASLARKMLADLLGKGLVSKADPAKRTGGLINELRIGRIIQLAIGLLTGGAEGAGDAQDPSRTIASERALNGAIVAGLFPTTHPKQTIRLRIMTGIVTRIVSNSGTRSWATV
ncbi:MAG TPA: hypothetical protein VGR71_12645, partial [Nitrospira sp.]|nr:hypothetical protein [Nitrospira sp.]